jgi:hypothetical protein
MVSPMRADNLKAGISDGLSDDEASLPDGNPHPVI